MSSNYYTHPEFGFLSPAPRLRRELRLTVFAGLCGAAIGAAGMVGLVIADRNEQPASEAHAPMQAPPRPEASPVNPPALSRTEVASNAPAQSSSSDPVLPESPPGRSATNDGSACDAHSTVSLRRNCLPDKPHRVPLRAIGNGPEIARLPLGRPAVPAPAPMTGQADHLSGSSAPAKPAQPALHPAGAEQVAASQAAHAAPLAAASPQRTVQSPARPAQPQPPLRPAHGEQVAVSEPPRPAALAAASPLKPTRQPSASSNNYNENKQQADRAARVSAAAPRPAEKLGNAYARDISHPRSVFWDWSR